MLFFERELRDKAFEKSQLGKEYNILKKRDTGTCSKAYELLKVRIYEDHTLLSVFQHAEGTNYSSRERIASLHLYLVAVMAAAAL